MLTSIVNQDNISPFYDSNEVQAILERVLTYAAAERDLRGFIPGAGWAHAVAHTADMLWVLASNRYLARADLERILAIISTLIAPPVAYVYLYNEDERLAHSVLGVLHRDLIPLPTLGAWIKQMLCPEGHTLGFDALLAQPTTSRRHNTISFLRALYFQVAGLTYTPASLPSGLPAYIADQIRQPPPCAPELLPNLVDAVQLLSVFSPACGILKKSRS